ncbi:MAG: NHL repeat-containing protein [bacterium]
MIRPMKKITPLLIVTVLGLFSFITPSALAQKRQITDDNGVADIKADSEHADVNAQGEITDVKSDGENRDVKDDKDDNEVAVGRKVQCLRTIYGIDGQRNPSLKEGLPKGIALDADGKLFAIFLERTEIQVFSPQGDFLYRFGKKGTEPGAFLLPISIEVADDGTVLVLDPELKKVLAFSNRGRFQYEFSFAGAKSPDDKKPVRCIKMGHRNNVLYLSDSANANIKLFNLKGDFLGIFPVKREKTKYLSVPGKTSFDSKGRIYIIDSLNGWVQVYDDKKELLFSFGEIGDRLGNFVRPVAVSVNSTGNIYVLDRVLSVIQIFNPEGKVVGVIKDTDIPEGLNSTEPFDMTMDRQGVIYVSLQGLHCIKVLKDE